LPAHLAWRWLSATLALATFLLAGCASPVPQPAPLATASPTPAPPLIEAAQVEILIAEFVVEPSALTIYAGTTVIWVNTDAARHILRADQREFDSGALLFGDTFSYTFTTPGEYHYSCPVHNDLEGRIVVIAP
jgi:plastocyanin